MQETYSGKGSKGKFGRRRPKHAIASNERLTCGNTEFVEEREFSQLLLLPLFKRR